MKKTIYFPLILFLGCLSTNSAFAVELQGDTLSGSCHEIKEELKTPLANSPACLKRHSAKGCSLKLSCLRPNLKGLTGTTFSALGPNCFAAALYGATLYKSFRGVSVLEFEEVLTSSCSPVEAPKIGDLGVYYIDDFGPSHAYTFISKRFVFEKPGVDYLGKTPMRFNFKSSVDFTHLASKECRQWGDESCYSKHKYYRCSKVSVSKNFEHTLGQINNAINFILVSNVISEETLVEFTTLYKNLYLKLSNLAKTPLEKSIVHSIALQITFLEIVKPTPNNYT